MLALAEVVARPQRRQHADRGEHPGAVVRLQPHTLHGRLAWKAVGPHHAAGRLRDQIGSAVLGIRPRLPERADGYIDQPRVVRFQVGVAETEVGEPSGGRRLDQHVRGRGESREQIPTVLLGEVERHAAFTGVVEPERQTLLGVWRAVQKRADPPRRVSIRRLDLDDVGAQIAQQLSAHRALEVGQVEHPQAGQCSRSLRRGSRHPDTPRRTAIGSRPDMNISARRTGRSFPHFTRVHTKPDATR